MDAKQIYREFSRNEPSLPIFSRDWWLDAAVGEEGWNAAVVEKDGQVLASMPYIIRRRYGMRAISQPALTPRLGPWIRRGKQRIGDRLGNEKDLMQALIDKLPEYDHFSQSWDYNLTNWLPFWWNGFEQTTYYTYVLHDLSDTGKLWSSFHVNVRTACKKAIGRYGLTVRDDLPLDALLELNHMTFRRQGLPVPYTDDFVRRLYAACAQRDCGKFWIATDERGRHYAGNYIVWDENSAYGLISGADPETRNCGATTLCNWQAIQHAAKVTKRFDFGGSMIEPVERFFRDFNAAQMPYFALRKTPSTLLRLRAGLQSIVAGGRKSRAAS